MHRCLELAAIGRGRVGNGALVGAVLVRNGTVIAEAFHDSFGGLHAERALLESYSSVEPQDTLYVNLEPCCHYGKTPPCTDVIIQKGVKTVVYGMDDPDARISGKGIKALQEAGVIVIGPFEQALCERLNKGFIQVRKKRRPYITLKQAVSRSGSIANDDGSMLKITSPEQDAWSHCFLRATHDAILIGIGTVISDNPQLNIRFDHNPVFSFTEGLNEKKANLNNSINPFRIILDPNMKIDLRARLISDNERRRTILCVTPQAAATDPEKTAALHERGVRMLSIPKAGAIFDWLALWSALMTPCEDFCGITSILVEGGGKTWQVFRSAGLVDEDVTLVGGS